MLTAIRRPGFARRMFRYSVTSVVATAVSQAALLCLYGAAGLGARPAAFVATLCGAVPSYYMNRAWAWGKQGRSHIMREVVPYLAMTLAGLIFATWATGVAGSALQHSHYSHGARTVLVGLAYMGSFAALWLAKFAVNEVLFGPPGRRRQRRRAAPGEV